MRRRAFVLASLLAGAPLFADTNKCGTITASETWPTAGSPYIITCNVTVENNGALPTLTIQAGVTVKFNAGTQLIVGSGYNGKLTAIGTSSSKITFTANTASPTRGFWGGIKLLTYASASSTIRHANVYYGGVASQWGCILLQGGNFSLQNNTIQNCLHSGVAVLAGAPTISSSTLSSNDWGLRTTSSPTLSSSTVSSNTYGGVYLDPPGGPKLQSVTITNNTGYAVSQDARQTLQSGSSITATGNTENAIEIRNNGYVDVSTTWRAVGIPYVLAQNVYVHKNGAPVPVLTIEPGVTIRAKQGGMIRIGADYPGELQANGTAAAPITFTAHTASPAPGWWQGFRFYNQSAATSKISFASVSYAGLSDGAVVAYGSSPTIQNVSFQSNGYAAVRASGGAPTVVGCSFVSNGNGVVNDVPANIVMARFNFWNAVTGPSGSGPGSGQSVSAGVKFEPWLTAAQSPTQYFNSFTGSNRTFNPSIGVLNHLTMGSALTGNWTLDIMNSGGAVVRTATGSGTSAAFNWDGKNGSGVLQPNGTYTYEFRSMAAGGATATPARGLAIKDTTLALGLVSPAVAPPFFSPNADTVQDSAALSSGVTFDGGTWTVNVKNSGGTTVRTANGSGGTISYAWDGKNGSAVTQPDGVYTFSVSLVNDGAQATVTGGTSTLDNTLPTSAITAPASGATLSNVYQNGVTDVSVVGTATDTNFNNWILDYGAGASPPSWTGISSGATPVSAAQVGSWLTAPIANGLYTLRLRVFDKAGNLKATTRPETIGNFSATKSTELLDNAAGGSVLYTSTVPFTLNETLVIKNKAGAVVRTLVNQSRAAGVYNDTWNGRNTAGALVPDGPYFYVATLTAGASSMIWDLTSQLTSDAWDVDQGRHATGWDPFNNSPMSIPYDFPPLYPGTIGRIYLRLNSPDVPGPGFNPVCDPPHVCLIEDEYQNPDLGLQNFVWGGADQTGVYRGEFLIADALRWRAIPKNAVGAFGTKPTITNVTVTPPFYGPVHGSQTVSFNLATFQNQTANITIAFLNHKSLTVLRTLTLPNRSPGLITTAWDGRAETGFWVAPGFYTVKVTATDTIGNVVSSHIMTTIVY